jgi:hypothetical protein
MIGYDFSRSGRAMRCCCQLDLPNVGFHVARHKTITLAGILLFFIGPLPNKGVYTISNKLIISLKG